MTNENFGAILGPFSPKFVLKPILLEKLALSVFKSYHHAKNQKKLVTHSWEKYRYTWIKRQADSGYFLGASVGLGSKKTFSNVVHTSQSARYLHLFIVEIIDESINLVQI